MNRENGNTLIFHSFYKWFSVIREQNNPHIMVPLPDDIHTNIVVIKLNKSRITANDFVHRLLTVIEKISTCYLISSRI